MDDNTPMALLDILQYNIPAEAVLACKTAGELLSRDWHLPKIDKASSKANISVFKDIYNNHNNSNNTSSNNNNRSNNNNNK